jgi:hypothetical protein
MSKIKATLELIEEYKQKMIESEFLKLNGL